MFRIAIPVICSIANLIGERGEMAKQPLPDFYLAVQVASCQVACSAAASTTCPLPDANRDGSVLTLTHRPLATENGF